MCVFNYEAVVFDFDGTIFDSSALKINAFKELYKEYGETTQAKVINYHFIIYFDF